MLCHAAYGCVMHKPNDRVQPRKAGEKTEPEKLTTK